MELSQHAMSTALHCHSMFDVDASAPWEAVPPRFNTLDDLKEALSNFVDLNGSGGLALELGLDALAHSSGKAPIVYETRHVENLLLKAFRNPQTAESPCEIILAAIGVWGMIENLDDEARSNLMSLLEVGFSIVDQKHASLA